MGAFVYAAACSPSLNSQSLIPLEVVAGPLHVVDGAPADGLGVGCQVVVGEGDLDALKQNHRGGVVLHVGGERALLVLASALLAGRRRHPWLLRGGDVHGSMTA